MRHSLVVLMLAAQAGAAGHMSQDAPPKIGTIDFFGYRGLDIEAVRKAVDSLDSRELLVAAVHRAIRKEPTDVALVCCDERGQGMVYIGLPGESTRTFQYNPQPAGKERFPAEITRLNDRKGEAFIEAIRRGDNGEDDSRGYALFRAPAVRAIQLKLRDYARSHASAVYRVLSHSGDASQRALAAELLGYVPSSDRQLAALVRAARDPDSDTRNNATRALGVLANARPEMAARIPPGPFIEMLWSGQWSDRNKAAWLLESMTRARDPELLGRLRREAVPPLEEMARWRNPGHSGTARAILERCGIYSKTN